MEHISGIVAAYMTPDPETVAPDTTIDEVARLLQGRKISSVPVVDGQGNILGVVSMTDLLRDGIVGWSTRGYDAREGKSTRTAAQLMTQGALVTTPETLLGVAARDMLRLGVHRLYVVKDGRVVGVLSMLDLACAVRDAKFAAPLSSAMSTPVAKVDVQTSIASATELLDRLHVSALVVVDEDWPVGMFTQPIALACRDMEPTTPVEAVLDTAMICLPQTTKLHRAAAHIASLDVRTVIACHDRDAIGVITGTDLARLIALP